MFRILDNVPEIYINESRDFQLLARLSDVIFSGIRYDVDSIVNLLDPMLTTDNLLDLMCTKVGFFPRINIDAQVLKYIIASFPYIIKNKGNKLGIEYAVNAVLKAEASDLEKSKVRVQIINNLDETNHYVVKILTAVEIYNKAALKEVLRYVVPAGYHILIQTYASISENKPDIFTLSDIITTMKVNRYNSGTIRSSNSDLDDIIKIEDIKSKLKDNQRKARQAIYANNYIATEIITANTPQLINEGNS